MTDAFVTAVKVLASLSALYMCLSPSTSMYRIHRARSTGPMSLVPLVALWGCNHMWLLYGYVTSDIFPLMITYIVGDITSVAFIAVYYRYTTDKRFALKACAITMLINACVTVYAVLGMHGQTNQNQRDVELIVGCIAIASSVLLYASPFATIKHVIKIKSSESIPFAMVLVGIVNNAFWILYGCLVRDALLVIPCVINIVIGAVQIVLYFMYHPKRQKPGTVVGASASGGAIEIVTTTPGLVLPAPVTASTIADDAHLTATAATHSDELTLSGIQIDSESSYVEVRSPGRMHLTSSSNVES